MSASNKAAIANRSYLDALVARMYADYKGGLTLEEVGQKHGGRTMSAVWALFRNRGLPRRTKPLQRTYERIAAARRSRLDALVATMHADYQRPMSLHAVAAKYGRSRGCIHELFIRRGLPVRPFKEVPRQANGSPVRYVPFTERQISAMIARATVFAVPVELKFEWRRWSLARRGQFIARLRARLNRPEDRPEKPFSANVEPFDYASPHAHEIATRMNAGRGSRAKAVQLMTVSQGVIYQERLYFWASDGGGSAAGAYYIGPWRPGTGRPSLHKIIWEEHHGRKMPRGHVIRMIDGNPNNLTPENMVLETRNDVCRENQAKALTRKSRSLTSLLLNRSRQRNKTHDTHTLTQLSTGIQ